MFTLLKNNHAYNCHIWLPYEEVVHFSIVWAVVVNGGGYRGNYRNVTPMKYNQVVHEEGSWGKRQYYKYFSDIFLN